MIAKFANEHAFLSNFYRHPIEWRGLVWPTTEHAFQAAKTPDPAKRERIRRARSPGDAKRLGRPPRRGGIVNDLREDWEQVKDDVMFAVNVVKFNTPLDLPLRDTYPHDLIEGNTWHDNDWGDCVCGREACLGTGRNGLGIVLMRVRATLL